MTSSSTSSSLNAIPPWVSQVQTRVRARLLDETYAFESLVELNNDAEISIKQLLSHMRSSTSELPSTFSSSSFGVNTTVNGMLNSPMGLPAPTQTNQPNHVVDTLSGYFPGGVEPLQSSRHNSIADSTHGSTRPSLSRSPTSANTLISSPTHGSNRPGDPLSITTPLSGNGAHSQFTPASVSGRPSHSSATPTATTFVGFSDTTPAVEHFLSRLRRELAAKNDVISNFEIRSESLERVLQERMEKVVEQTGRISELTSELDSSRERINAMEGKLNFVRDQTLQVAGLNSKVASLEEEIAALRKELRDQREEQERALRLAAAPGGASDLYSENGLAFREDDLRRGALGWNIPDKNPTPPRAKSMISSSSHVSNATVGRYIVGGDFFVSGGADGVLRFHSSRTHSGAHSLSVSKQAIMALAVSPDTRSLAFGGADRMVYVCPSSARREQVVGLVHPDPISGCAFAGSDILVTTCSARSDCVRIWDLKNPSPTRCAKFTLESAPRALAAAPTTGRFATAHYDKGINLWQLGSQTATVTTEIEDAHDQRITSVLFSPDESSLLSTAWDAVVRIRDTRSRGLALIHELSDGQYANKDEYTRACFSPNGRFVLAGDYTGAIFAWDLRNASEPYTVIKHPKAIQADGKKAVIDLDWNNNGKQVGIVNKSGQVIFYEHATGDTMCD